MRKLLIPLQGDFVAQRFDLAAEVVVVRFDHGQYAAPPKTVILERPSDEELCQMIVRSNVTDVVCGGIDELHYNFLTWKKVSVIDAVIGGWRAALERAVAGTLQPREILAIEQGLKL
jgi:hypothetical protein